MTLVESVDKANDEMRKHFITKIATHYNNDIAGKTFAIWGLAFKPQTDDIRCAPAIDVIKYLLKHNANVQAYDPVAQDNMETIFGSTVMFCSSADQTLKNADALVLLTEWKEFKETPLDKLKNLNDTTVFDARNFFNTQNIAAAGLQHITIGRNVLSPATDQTNKTSSEKKYHYAAQL